MLLFHLIEISKNVWNLVIQIFWLYLITTQQRRKLLEEEIQWKDKWLKKEKLREYNDSGKWDELINCNLQYEQRYCIRNVIDQLILQMECLHQSNPARTQLPYYPTKHFEQQNLQMKMLKRLLNRSVVFFIFILQKITINR